MWKLYATTEYLSVASLTWCFLSVLERTEAETAILWPPDAKSRLSRERPWCWERLKAGGEGGSRGWDGWMASSTQCMNLSKFFREMVKDREVWRAAVHGIAKSWTHLSGWTELNWVVKSYHKQGFREQKDPPPAFTHPSQEVTHPKNMLSQKILCKFQNDLWAFWYNIHLFSLSYTPPSLLSFSP